MEAEKQKGRCFFNVFNRSLRKKTMFFLPVNSSNNKFFFRFFGFFHGLTFFGIIFNVVG